MKNIFKSDGTPVSNDIFPPVMIRYPKTTTQEFRLKTISDIAILEDTHHEHLAKLEAEKLIAHLKNEFGL